MVIWTELMNFVRQCEKKQSQASVKGLITSELAALKKEYTNTHCDDRLEKMY